MVEILANTDINTAVEDGVCNGETYSMTDRNWMDQDPFEPNVASAFYLPPVLGCRWELWLLKRFDPIVGNNNCQCDDEDHVHFEDGDGNEKKYCDFTDPPESMDVGWCANNFGPHNVHIQPAFVTGKKLMPYYYFKHLCLSHLIHYVSLRANYCIFTYMRDKGMGCILPRRVHRKSCGEAQCLNAAKEAQEVPRKFQDCTEVLAFSIKYLGVIL